MANTTLLDLAKRSGIEQRIGIVEAMMQSNPLVSAMSMSPIQGISFDYSRRTSLPTVGFRAFNEGVATTKSVIEKKTITTKILNARSDVDTMLADNYIDGADAYRAIEAGGHLAAMGNKFDYTCFYGNAGTTPEEFDGAYTILNSTAIATCIQLTGTTGSTGSIYAFAFEDAVDSTGRIKGCEGVVANGKLPSAIDRGVHYSLDSGGTNSFPVYRTEFEAQMGLAVYDTRSIGRICGISTSIAPAAANINALITAMRPFKPSVFIMPPAIWNLVMALKTAIYYQPIDTDLFGRVETWAGIPLLVADNLVMTETSV